MKMKKRSAAAIVAAVMLVTGVTAVFATSKAPEPKNIEDLPHAVMSNALPTPTLPAPADKSEPAVNNRVHPVTGQPAGTDVQQPGEAPAGTPTGPYYNDLPEGHLHRDALTPNPANCWGIPEGPIAAGTEIFAHNEEEYREMIRQLRMMGYDGHIGPVRYSYKIGAVLDKEYDGVQRTIEVPKGIMPDWTYPVNSKGETYGTMGNLAWLGYDPDLISVVATNGKVGYLSSELCLKTAQAGVPYPVYDLNGDNVVGYFEFDNGKNTNSATQAKIDKLNGQENRWGVPNIDPLPLGYMIPAESEQDMWDLINYLCQSRGLTIYDISHGHNTYDNGIEEWEVTISYQWSREYGGKPPADGKDYYNWPASDVSSIADRWNVPADPIPIATKIQAGTLKDEAELKQYLMQVRGLRAGDMVGCINSSGTHSILITYEQTEREKRLANGYPVNSRGETYGTTRDRTFMGYSPDLILVEATNGLDGYAFDRELQFGDYPGETDTREGFKAFLEWQRTQPSSRLVKVYDVDRNNVIGYFRVADGRDTMTQEEELEMIANQMRNWGNSEEQIAKDLEIYKQTRGWK